MQLIQPSASFAAGSILTLCPAGDEAGRQIGPEVRLPMGCYQLAMELLLRADPDPDQPVVTVMVARCGAPGHTVHQTTLRPDQLWRDGLRARLSIFLAINGDEADSRYSIRLINEGQKAVAVERLDLREIPLLPGSSDRRSIMPLMKRKAEGDSGPLTVSYSTPHGTLIWGPYMVLPRGFYEVEFLVRLDHVIDPSQPVMRFDVFTDTGATCIEECAAYAHDLLLRNNERSFRMHFQVGSKLVRKQIEFRAWNLGNAELTILDVRLGSAQAGLASPQHYPLMDLVRTKGQLRWHDTGLLLPPHDIDAALLIEDIPWSGGDACLEVSLEVAGLIDTTAPLIEARIECVICGSCLVYRAFHLDEIWRQQDRVLCLLPLTGLEAQSRDKSSSQHRFRLDLHSKAEAPLIIRDLVLHNLAAQASYPAGWRSLRGFLEPGPQFPRGHASVHSASPVRRLTPIGKRGSEQRRLQAVTSPLALTAGHYELQVDLSLDDLPDAERPFAQIIIHPAHTTSIVRSAVFRIGDIKRQGNRHQIVFAFAVNPAMQDAALQLELWSEGSASFTIHDIGFLPIRKSGQRFGRPETLDIRPALQVPQDIRWTGNGYFVPHDRPPGQVMNARFTNFDRGVGTFAVLIDIRTPPEPASAILRLEIACGNNMTLLSRNLGPQELRASGSLHLAHVRVTIPESAVGKEFSVTLSHLGSADWTLRRLDWQPAAHWRARATWLVIRILGVVDRLFARREETH